ncbi:MAG: oligosaccharide flippase family protein [Alphaproteobacteria bacterium]|nr:oligosaccharide flippase family protein [Alphaproteobacteria bacterium]
MAQQEIPDRSLRSAVMHGVTWLFLANISARLIGFAALYVTGLLLSKTDFALYAIAFSCSEMLSYLRNGGMQKILLQRGRSFGQLFPGVLGMSWTINLFWFLLLVAMAPVIANIYGSDQLMALVLVIAISIPAETIGALLQSKLAIDLRFGVLARLSIYVALVRNGGIIGFALLGFGPMSLAIPIVLVSLFATLYAYHKTDVRCRPKWPRRQLLKPLVRHSAWIMFGMIAMALAANGDYLAIGFLEEKATLGVYFFGFQLTVAIFATLTNGLLQVLIPSFASMNLDRSRQEYAFIRALEMSSLMIFSVSFAMAAVAEPLIHWIWSGKWDAAIPVVQILGVTAIMRVTFPLCRALLEARGQWRAVAVLSWCQAVGVTSSAALGAWLGGLTTIAISVGIYNMLMGLIYLIVINREVAQSIGKVTWSVFGPYLVAVLSLSFSWLLDDRLQVSDDPLIQTGMIATCYAVLYVIFAFIFNRTAFRECLTFAQKFRSRD